MNYFQLQNGRKIDAEDSARITQILAELSEAEDSDNTDSNGSYQIEDEEERYLIDENEDGDTGQVIKSAVQTLYDLPPVENQKCKTRRKKSQKIQKGQN